jgi:Fe-S-cluster containining protein
MNYFRSCGDCTACCTWLIGSSYGWEFGNGQSCKFKGCNGCKIHKVRPNVCVNYQCAWSQKLLPEEMRPDKCNVLVSVERNNDVQFLKAISINNSKMNSSVKSWLENWSKEMNAPVVYIEP